MQIVFDLSHLSNSRERADVEHTLRNALARINQACQGRLCKAIYKPEAALLFYPTYTFNLDNVFHPGASKVEESRVLRVLLDTLTSINLTYLRYRPNTLPLYRSGVIYGRTETWEPIPALYSRGYGDCKSLSCALIAQYLRKGVEAYPRFRWNPRDNGAKDFHILVQTIQGFEDPSRVLGMGTNENAYF